MSNSDSTEILQNMDAAISVMREAGKWLQDSGKKPSKWWRQENLNREFLRGYAKEDEFYVLLYDCEPAAAAVIQEVSESAGNVVYIHWLCVARKFAGKGLPRVIVEFAGEVARERGIRMLKVDTNADEEKLRRVYEGLGFRLLSVADEGYRKTAYYEKDVGRKDDCQRLL